MSFLRCRCPSHEPPPPPPPPARTPMRLPHASITQISCTRRRKKCKVDFIEILAKDVNRDGDISSDLKHRPDLLQGIV